MYKYWNLVASCYLHKERSNLPNEVICVLGETQLKLLLSKTFFFNYEVSTVVLMLHLIKCGLIRIRKMRYLIAVA